MRLERLKEDTQRWLDLMGVNDPINLEVHKAAKASPKAKEFIMKFRDEYGGGHYKVRIKPDEDGTSYNYGYYSRRDLPEIIIDPEKLTPEGRKKYAEFVAGFQQKKEDAVPEEELRESFDYYNVSRFWVSPSGKFIDCSGDWHRDCMRDNEELSRFAPNKEEFSDDDYETMWQKLRDAGYQDAVVHHGVLWVRDPIKDLPFRQMKAMAKFAEEWELEFKYDRGHEHA